jgi:hypothetical protein
MFSGGMTEVEQRYVRRVLCAKKFTVLSSLRVPLIRPSFIPEWLTEGEEATTFPRVTVAMAHCNRPKRQRSQSFALSVNKTDWQIGKVERAGDPELGHRCGLAIKQDVERNGESEFKCEGGPEKKRDGKTELKPDGDRIGA